MLLAGTFLFASQILATDTPDRNIVIGVLAYNGKQQALQRWQPTADYLARYIQPYRFEVLPLTHEEFIHAINKGQVDFILTNPGHYIGLEVKFGATRIATFKSRFHDKVLTKFSSVIFTSANSDIVQIEDLKGRSMAAVGEQAFGGFQLGYSELLEQNIDVFNDMTLMWLGFPQTDIVRSVLSGKAESGMVRSGILEKMAASGEIELSSMRVLGSRLSDDFPLLHSTALYPEWPIAQLPDTDSKLAKQVAITLLQMPEDAAPAVVSGGAGWTIPLDYLNVHELFRNLRIEPYPPVPLELDEFWQSYRYRLLLAGSLFLFSIIMIILALRHVRELKRAERALSDHGDRLESALEQRTSELNETNRALQREIESRLLLEVSLHEGCEILQTMNTVSNRHDLTRGQRLQSILDLTCQYLGEELAVLSVFDGDNFVRSIPSSGRENILAPIFPHYAHPEPEAEDLVRLENHEGWQSYIACRVFISDTQQGLLELGTHQKEGIETGLVKNRLQTEPGLQILNLCSYWLANEVNLDNYEKNTELLYQQTRSRFDAMTRRELEILQLVSDGKSNKSIARELNISPKTVELHRSNLLRKSNASSSIQLIKMATQSRLVN